MLHKILTGRLQSQTCFLEISEKFANDNDFKHEQMHSKMSSQNTGHPRRK